MNKHIIYPAQMDTQSLGRLKVRTTTQELLPIDNATVRISAPNDPMTVLEEFSTDSSGLSEEILLPAPPIDLSLEPSQIQPYSNYDLQISAPG